MSQHEVETFVTENRRSIQHTAMLLCCWDVVDLLHHVHVIRTTDSWTISSDLLNLYTFLNCPPFLFLKTSTVALIQQFAPIKLPFSKLFSAERFLFKQNSTRRFSRISSGSN